MKKKLLIAFVILGMTVLLFWELRTPEELELSDEYHEEFQDAYWLDDENVVINEKIVEIVK